MKFSTIIAKTKLALLPVPAVLALFAPGVAQAQDTFRVGEVKVIVQPSASWQIDPDSNTVRVPVDPRDPGFTGEFSKVQRLLKALTKVKPGINPVPGIESVPAQPSTNLKGRLLRFNRR